MHGQMHAWLAEWMQMYRSESLLSRIITRERLFREFKEMHEKLCQ